MLFAERALKTRPRDAVLAALVVFLGNILICLMFLDPYVQGYGDVVRGWRQFNDLLAQGSPFFDEYNQIELRIGMVFVTLAILFLLVSLGLIERQVLITYLLLPSSAYLATKIKIEFIFFPLAIISLKIGWKREIAVLAMIFGVTEYLSENNGLIIIAFRLAYYFFSAFKVKTYFVLAIAGVILFLDANISLLFPIVPGLSIYSWTRDIVNPEYSIIESVIVFSSSMVIGIQPQLDYPVAFLFTCWVMWASAGQRILRTSFYKEVVRQPGARAGFITILLFTSLTHAFQNARYYFFYVPMFTAWGGGRTNKILMLSSWPMMTIISIYYRIVLGY